MRATGNTCVPFAAALAVSGVAFLASCATTTRPQQFRTFFLPPARPAPTADETPIELPTLGLDLYANEVPAFTSSLPSLPRPSDTDFVIKTADDRFAAGKRAFQE